MSGPDRDAIAELAPAPKGPEPAPPAAWQVSESARLEQVRFTALHVAVDLARTSGITDAQDIVNDAEVFAEFLLKGSGG